MEFEEAVQQSQVIIDAICRNYARRNWRYELDDLRQEGLCALWQAWGHYHKDKPLEPFVRKVVSRRLSRVTERLNDPLYSAIAIGDPDRLNLF